MYTLYTMWMQSNVRTMMISRDEQNQVSVNEVDPSQVPQLQQEDMFIHPLLLAMTNAYIFGEEYPESFEEEKYKLTEDEFRNLETCDNLTNCAICMENKHSNIKLKCNHIFCKGCIKKWLTEKANTCPNCRTEI